MAPLTMLTKKEQQGPVCCSDDDESFAPGTKCFSENDDNVSHVPSPLHKFLISFSSNTVESVSCTSRIALFISMLSSLQVDVIGVGCYSSKDLWTWKNLKALFCS
ncbi:hypothetical protein HAX54_033926 [Datura stramonium]|uniref:Uncharacterized protein n=1 Tax=Datura stramonium TaxID=4076 RepID=A0ABS8SDR3_DATST|nr:hypothetical protein [Datura stramonium]